jgi:hypothetical protein
MYKDIKFVRLDERLYYKSMDGVLLQCLGQEEAKRVMSEVHDGLCGAHQSAYRMKWVSYGPPWAHYLSGYQDRLLGGPLGLPDMCRTVPDGVRRKDFGGEVFG